MSIEVVSQSTQSEAVASPKESVAQKDEGKETKSASTLSELDETAEDSEASEESDSEETLDGEESEAGESKDSDKQKKKSGFKKRIDKMRTKLSAKEQEAEYWKAEALKRQKSEMPEDEKARQNARVADERKPKAENFDSHEEYVEALTDWKIEQREKAKELKAQQESAKTEIEKKVSSHQERVEAFKKAHDDFDEVLSDVDDIPMSIAVQEVILESELGPELMYELASNPKEFERICSLSPLKAAKELGKIEDKIRKSAEAPKENKTTKAPPPIKTLSAKGAAVTKSLHDMDYEEFKRARDEEAKKYRR